MSKRVKKGPRGLSGTKNLNLQRKAKKIVNVLLDKTKLLENTKKESSNGSNKTSCV